jgi:hypothetical protein
VKFAIATRRATAILLCSSLAAIAGVAPDKKDKAKPPAIQAVDSGSFGVFVRGQRVVTETFSIAEQNEISTVKSQLKQIGADSSNNQKSELVITSIGELLRYEWNQDSAGSLTVVPNNDFLLERINATANGKPAEQPFLMPSTSVILDNNFFIQREVLLWRYLAADCKPEGAGLKCEQGPAEFGALVPQDRTSVRVRVELIGREKVTIRGAERELLRINLTSESFEWALWVDDHDQFKLIRVAIPADNTEVVRD